jgi:hypothetical protein
MSAMYCVSSDSTSFVTVLVCTRQIAKSFPLGRTPLTRSEAGTLLKLLENMTLYWFT